MNDANPDAHAQSIHLRDRLAEALGFVVEEYSPGFAKVHINVSDHHLNGMDMVHGGTLFALADFTMGLAANAHGQPAVSLNCTISYIRAGRDGIVRATATEKARTRRTGTYHVDITNEQGELLAVLQGTIYYLPPKPAEDAPRLA